jgi:hypothetical protein
MPSVFDPFANCYLVLSVTEGYSDGVNPEPIVEKVQVSAFLNTKSKRNSNKFNLANPGVQVDYADLTGYILGEIPANCSFPQQAIAHFKDGKEYSLMVFLPPTSPYFDEVSLLGTPCSCQYVT